MKEFKKVDKTQMSSERKNRNQDQNYNSDDIKNIDYIQEENNHNANENVIKKDDERFIEIKGDKCYNEINKLLNSNNCLYYYIIILIISLTTLVYSILCFFITLSNLK